MQSKVSYTFALKMAEKVVWMTVTRLCDEESGNRGLCCDGVLEKHSLLGVTIPVGATVKQTSAQIHQLLNLNDSGVVLQLRNSRGSLVPLNGKLEQNTKDMPYSLVILREYQRVTPKPRSVRPDTYTSTILGQTQIYLSRISNLENSIPELKVKREEKIKQEMRELEDKLNFLQKRFNEADQTEWTGIIKKSPLW